MILPTALKSLLLSHLNLARSSVFPPQNTHPSWHGRALAPHRHIRAPSYNSRQNLQPKEGHQDPTKPQLVPAVPKVKLTRIFRQFWENPVYFPLPGRQKQLCSLALVHSSFFPSLCSFVTYPHKIFMDFCLCFQYKEVTLEQKISISHFILQKWV